MKTYKDRINSASTLEEINSLVNERNQLSLGEQLCESLGLTTNVKKLVIEVSAENSDAAFVTATFVYKKDDLSDFYDLIETYKMTKDNGDE